LPPPNDASPPHPEAAPLQFPPVSRPAFSTPVPNRRLLPALCCPSWQCIARQSSPVAADIPAESAAVPPPVPPPRHKSLADLSSVRLLRLVRAKTPRPP